LKGGALLEVQRRFTERVAEVEAYFGLVSRAHESGANICSDNRQSGWPLDSDAQRLLRASGFLVLYNLVESTISDGLTAILTTIEGECVAYTEASDNVRVLWVKGRVGDKVDAGNIAQEAHALVADALNKAIVKIDQKTVMKGGGNIDTARIRAIATIVGFERSAGAKAERGGSSLDLVKQKRNTLAHGDYGFLEVGRNYTEADMQRIKEQVICYIDAVLQNMARYLISKTYLRK